MKKILLYFFKHPVISGSTVFFLGSGAESVFAYLFNLSMGRMLSVVDYGVLAVLIALVNFSHVFSASITMMFSKFTAILTGQGRENKTWSLFRQGTRWIGIGALALLVFIILGNRVIAGLLRIEPSYLIGFIGLVVLFTFISAILYGILQGKLKFGYFSFALSFTAFIKFALGLLLVALGLGLFGAFGAIVASVVIEYLLLFYFFSKLVKGSRKEDLAFPDLQKRFSFYGLPVLLSGLGMNGLITFDIILVKYFFPPIVAGQYAALSLMGRSIFYFILPIPTVLFPVIAQKSAKGEKILKTTLTSIGLVALLSLPVSIIYFLFPNLILKIFFPGAAYISIAHLLGPFSIFIVLFTFSWLLKNFFLAVGKTNVFILTLGAAMLQTLYIIFFHNSLLQVILGMIIITFLLLVALLLYCLILYVIPKIRKQRL